MSGQIATRKPMQAFAPATLRGVTRAEEETGRLGVSVDTEDGRILRFTLDAANALALSEMLSWAVAAYEKRSHSDKSSGMLRVGKAFSSGDS